MTYNFFVADRRNILFTKELKRNMQNFHLVLDSIISKSIMIDSINLLSFFNGQGIFHSKINMI